MIQKTLRLSAVALASLFAFGAAHAAGATLNIDGNIEQDNTYGEAKRAPAGAPSTKTSGLNQTGRVEVNFTGKATNGDAFVAGKGTLLAQKAGTAATDDMWVQFGTSAGDLKLGRFEGVDMWPVGRDTILNRASDTWRGQTLRGRVGVDTFHAEGTVNIAPGMQFMLGIVERKGNDSAAGAKGLRPIFAFSTGGISAKLGIESGKINAGNKFTGVAATAGMGLAGGNLNANLALGKIKNVSDDTTFGVNYTMDMGPWALLEYGQSKPKAAGGTTTKITTLGLGYQLSLLGVKGATVTPAVDLSQAKTGGSKNTNTDLRVRFNYGFNAF